MRALSGGGASNGGQSGLQLSDRCVLRLQQLAPNGEPALLRLSVEGGGCSGFQYKFQLEQTISPDDKYDLNY